MAVSPSTLVTYATLYGSTREVAESIATTLRENGLEVDIEPMRGVQSLDKYDAVVMGAPLYISKLYKDTQRFLEQHQGALVQRPVAVFALGPLGTDEQEMVGSRGQLDEELKKYPWLKPVAREVFIGKYDPAKLNLLHKLLALLPASPLHGRTASDHRDWDAIRAWAGGLPAKLQSKTD